VKYTYRTQGVCSSSLEFEIEEGLIHGVAFEGGCDGNLKAVGKLVEGRSAKEIISVLDGNLCGDKPTSCADQLAKALRAALDREAEEA